MLFIERCLDLLKPGGRLGIVLPEGIFNNPSLTYVREFVEDRARLLAVVGGKRPPTTTPRFVATPTPAQTLSVSFPAERKPAQEVVQLDQS